MSSPWADGQCSRTSGYQRSREVRETVKKTMTSFNISSLVKDSSSVSRPGVPVGVVTARQRVTTTTDMEIVTSLAPASAPPPPSFLSASSPHVASHVVSAPFLAPGHHLMSPLMPQPPHLVTSLPQLHPMSQAPAAPQALYPPTPPSPYIFGFPDPHYYYFLQQQLLMLQHHHYLQSQVPALRGLSVPNPAANINFLQSLENSVNSLKNPEPVKQVDDGIIVDKLIHNTDAANTESCHDIRTETNDQDEDFLEVESSQSDLREKPAEECDNPQDVTVATDESFINVDDEEEDEVDTSLKCQEDTCGLNLLAASIDKLEDSPDGASSFKARKLRYASTDCAGLQILCDVADSQEKITAASEKTEQRSKSVDCDSRRNEVRARVDESKCLKMQNDIAQMGKSCLDLSKKLVRMEKIKKKKIKIKKSRQREVKAAERLRAVSGDEREAEDTQEETSEKEDSSGVGVNILTSFTETFQKFKKSYLSKNAADSKQPQNIQKKIPTLENWTTIMKEKKLKMESEVQETGFNNNLNVRIEETVSENQIITTVQRTVTSSVKEGCCSLKEVDQKVSTEKFKSIHVDEDLKNNNDWAPHQRETKENDFISLKKKIKLKKKYKEQQKIQTAEKQSEEVDSNTKKRKKKKKDKKERKEKERKEKKEKKKDKEKRTVTSASVIVVTPAPPPETPPMSVDHQPLPSCGLTSADLTDGLRVLLRLGGHFHPARLTEISAPDIYGIVVDKERGNKPHILSREEVLQRAVRDVMPPGTHRLTPGMRVAAYWSSQMSFLHPGTVTGPDPDPDYVVIQLDDGDSRDIHHKMVRLLPPGYPIVEMEQNSPLTITVSRKRGGSTEKRETKPEKVKRTENKRHKEKKRRQKDRGWSVSVTEIPEKKEEVKEDVTNDDDDADETEEPRTPDDTKTTSSSSHHSPIAAFLPPQQALWTWADPGWRQSSKSRRLNHSVITKRPREGEEAQEVRVGDCAVFLSTSRPDRPYIGRIHSLWQTAGGNMKVQVRWFYHPAEVEGTAEGGGRVQDLEVTSNALFSSSHEDQNDVQTISHRCSLLELEEFKERLAASDTEDVYYLAGEYEPVLGVIKFKPGVIQ